MDNLEKYEQLKSQGISAEDVYRIAQTDGLTSIERIKLIRELYNLGLREAKEISIVASGIASSLDEHQSKIADALQNAIDRGEFNNLIE